MSLLSFIRKTFGRIEDEVETIVRADAPPHRTGPRRRLSA